MLKILKKKIKPLLDRIYEIIDTLRPSKDSHLYTAVTYARNQKEKLYYFLDDSNVEMTNNLAEQTVKSYVINRKNFLFSDTEKGADASAAVMSIIETAKRNNLDVYGYLTHLLTVLPEWGKNPTDLIGFSRGICSQDCKLISVIFCRFSQHVHFLIKHHIIDNILCSELPQGVLFLCVLFYQLLKLLHSLNAFVSTV